MVGIQQRALESVAVEEESAVVDKRVYHEQDGGSEARPQERVWWVVVGGVGCVSTSVAPRQGSARRWPFPRRSPPRIVPGMSDVECLSVGRRREGVDSVGASRRWIFLVREVVAAGGPRE